MRLIEPALGKTSRRKSVFGMDAVTDAARRWMVFAVAAGVFLGKVPLAVGAQVDFNRDIRPILSQNCFFCHGPDENERKGGPRRSGGMRLDTISGQRADLGGHFAVVPGKPEESELVRRLVTKDKDDLMPPSETGKALSSEQIELVRTWIADGARFSNHWAYERPERPPLPGVLDPAWVRNGIDRFVMERLEKEGLKPQPEADRRTLARRAALDLTGLPPSVEEVQAFLADRSEKAYERYIDRLLAKESYGEHWARMWLDLSRYADSAGYADDPPRVIWPYRDYVISAFNRNLPFDQFTIEQLAGDLLPDPTEDQMKATAFHRNTMTNSEGGTNDEEFRNVAVVDRVNTTFAVWMGTSMACAQCHSHKYDPISQKEYFQLFAFLNNTADADRPDEAPLYEFDSAEVREKRTRLTRELAALDETFRSAVPNLTEASSQWARVFPSSLTWVIPKPSGLKAESGAGLEVGDDLSVFVTPKATNVLKDNYTIELPFDSAMELTGVRVEALADERLGEKGPGIGGNFFLRQVRAKILPVPNQPGPGVRYVRVEQPRKGVLRLAEVQVFSGGDNVARSGTTGQSSTQGAATAALAVDGTTDGASAAGSSAISEEQDAAWWQLDLGMEVPVERLVLWPGGDSGGDLEGLRIVALNAEKKTVWERPSGNPAVRKKELALDLNAPKEVEFVNASADFNQDRLDEALVAHDAPQSVRYRKRGEKGWAVGGATGRNHALFLTTSKPVEVPRGATLVVTLVQSSSADRQTLGRFRLGVTSDRRAVDFVDMPPQVRAILAVGEASRSPEQARQLAEYFVRDVAPGLRSERERYASAQREKVELKPLTVPVTRELSGKDRRATKVQLRGNFLVTADEVSEGVPAVWPALPDGAVRNRLTLARWLMSDENPLTARVVANRFWEQVFGTGIVRTSEEFGSQGEAPVNQKLLDWLACELRDGRWDVKRFLKLLVTSAAYRQSSKVTPEALEKDPENRLLSRGPRFRMGAEMVRDQALAAAGLLSSKMYGPSVRPPRPSLDLRAAFGGNLDWQPSPGEDRFRRGLYTEWRRTSPYPSMATFDAPSREVCTLRRNRSNTPLQALVTLNDPVYVEAAQGLARRMRAAGDDEAARIRRGYEIVLTREPSARETEELRGMLRDVREEFAKHPERARSMSGEPARAEGSAAGVSVADPVDAASWTAVANVILNLDETLMKR